MTNYSDVLLQLVLPLGLGLELLAIGWFFSRWSRRGAQICIGLGIVVIVVFSLPLTSSFLIRSLESRHPLPAHGTELNADVVVLLGGGVRLPSDSSIRTELGPGSDRLLAAFQLWMSGSAPNILVTSGNPSIIPSEATLTAEILKSWGVPENAIIKEENSQNTLQNAVRTGQILRERRMNRVLLVTSATHMPRAMALFHREKLEVVAVAADHWITDSKLTWGDFVPRSTSLDGSSRVLHEYIGMFYYLLVDRIEWSDLRFGLNI